MFTPQPAKKERKTIDFDTKMTRIKQYEVEMKGNAIVRDRTSSHSIASKIARDSERICNASFVFVLACFVTKMLSAPVFWFFLKH